MTDEDHADEEIHESHLDDPHATPATARSTAPQSDFSTSQVGIGFAILVVGLIVAFGIPLAVTL
jgi:hypothetical protein